MPQYRYPGIYIEEVATGARSIQAVGMSTAGFVGVAPNRAAHVQQAVAVTNWSQFLREFADGATAMTPLAHGVFGFFNNGGQRCFVVNIGDSQTIGGEKGKRRGLDLLEAVDEVAIVAAPGYCDAVAYDQILTHCEKCENRVAILDAPENVSSIDQLVRVATPTAAATPATPAAERRSRRADADADAAPAGGDGPPPGLKPRQSDRGFGAFYFPRIMVADPFEGGKMATVAPSGHIAGVWARTDGTRGVHKAPANETIRGALGVAYSVTNAEQAELNPAGVNCIRFFPREGVRIWGARTVGDGAGEWKYLNVRRLFTMIEESVRLSTRWVVFEPNDRPLWKSIRRDITAFLTLLWRDGALMGATPEQAFFVKCDEETNPQEVVDAGMVVTMIGIAPVKPAEFIVFRIGQHAGGTDVTV